MLTVKIHALRLEVLNGIKKDRNNYTHEDYEDHEDTCASKYIGLYESRIDHIDEIKTLKETLAHLKANNEPLYTRMMQGETDLGKQNEFKEILEGIERLVLEEGDLINKLEKVDAEEVEFDVDKN